jgi:mono/diheme cytochrome c family protein
MRTQFLAIALLVLFAPCASAQQSDKSAQKAPAAETPIPPEAIKQTNPVTPTASSQAQAKKTYGYDCAMCHGANGDGKGDLATDMKLKMPDYRDPATLKDKTDGQLFYVIKNGRGEMPAEGDRVKPDEVWNMVIYVRSFAKKEAAAKPKPDNP